MAKNYIDYKVVRTRRLELPEDITYDQVKHLMKECNEYEDDIKDLMHFNPEIEFGVDYLLGVEEGEHQLQLEDDQPTKEIYINGVKVYSNAEGEIRKPKLSNKINI